jgi:organic hydroperoxide reductase OsmC/OhrA
MLFHGFVRTTGKCGDDGREDRDESNRDDGEDRGGFHGDQNIHLDVSAKIPGAGREAFEAAANQAKSGCPISRLLNTKITMDARLES